MKENKYDDPVFFEQYGKMMRSTQGLEGAGEWHVLKKMLPELQGLRLLDLGCGYGWHCRYAIEQGATQVVGVDISEKMIEKARRINSPPGVQYIRSSVEDFHCEAAFFDVVLSSLTFHYIASFGAVCDHVGRCLKPGGYFVFSVEHPVFTAEGRQDWIYDADSKPLYWPVDRYFSEGERTAVFLGSEVKKYHRTLTTYLQELLQHGFRILDVREPMPDPAMLQNVPGMKDELRRPMMLLVSAVKA